MYFAANKLEYLVNSENTIIMIITSSFGTPRFKILKQNQSQLKIAIETAPVFDVFKENL